MNDKNELPVDMSALIHPGNRFLNCSFLKFSTSAMATVNTEYYSQLINASNIILEPTATLQTKYQSTVFWNAPIFGCVSCDGLHIPFGASAIYSSSPLLINCSIQLVILSLLYHLNNTSFRRWLRYSRYLSWWIPVFVNIRLHIFKKVYHINLLL